MDSFAVKIEGLTKVYKDFWKRKSVPALTNLNLEIKQGEIFGLLGPNGSGKTTTVKLLLGFLHPTSGRSWLLGKPSGHIQTKNKIGFLPEESYLYTFLNAEEILDFYGKLFNLSRKERKERIDKLIYLVGLNPYRKRLLSKYSKGMLRRIGIAQAIINDPDLIILDEPTSGLDPIGRREIKELISEFNKQGKTVLLCSHLLADVQSICSRIAILNKGVLQVSGNVKELLCRNEVMEFLVKNLSDGDLELVKKFIAEKNGEVLSMHPHRSTLEELFVNIIQQHN
ncbi:putative ABC-type transport system (ATPase component) [Candidatus Kuenenia stuttgartiensis]|uniref:Putative ABC-type transport system (ATPase component) n=1 Tax=Kuenenia stuttgartiensis TaxID=174633 RepID=Q1PZR9_KUEST|nr:MULTISPECIES: ABC transporter ATP-binding protein [Kuenenia]MBE7546645.1 ABC transporter ATP-binding protein [Planctomycetia bacterium]MBW7943531.1 ABC transporter ATP-binding protein [Candidatus Kuenenia stuttgartiensis]MBZ0191004.1 ABC transporter ATP-binding protein [Candidatus Kuenenia stuttgartiensis]MCF6151211.1 ABC transporter ATP-binding protein [Candidatus Kuenenia stuttgartiensis]MCL4726051.1 ABC transporter ATP-binding protein [Candidatus Kuenenia stuttgartiensis]